ncbi:GTP cyclohydrolase 1 [Colletotrichum spinosum]|uniref:GTP cyclohydrolase 1 n=1 Tax=Colletotrichum spinosum TaxID=1347390 RepID=A0A4R8QP60_9PEZI|nr:GTP cyclohydrolase 1 [Colletotrichum spinosum]
MTQSEAVELKRSNKHKRDRRNGSNSSSPATSSDAETVASQSSSKRGSKKSKRKARDDDDGQVNGHSHTHKKRRPSLSQPARDPRDTTTPKKKKSKQPKPEGVVTRSPSPVIDFDGLSRPSVGTRERLDENPEQAAERLEKLKGAVRTILECVGEDPDRPGLLDTPRRYAEAMLFFTKGYQQNVQDIVNNAIFQEGHNEMVIIKDIEVYSLCEHHLVPFTGKMHIAYIPKNQVIGLSKLPRIAELFSRRLQIQERLTKEVAYAIMEVLKPQGVAVVMESSHLCMVMRGVQKTTTSTITSCVLGAFEKKEKTRNEFLSLVGLKK